MTRPRLTWDKGGTAEIIAISTDTVTLRSTIPSPPGSRIEGTLTLDPPAKVRFKVHGSKLQEDGAFILVGRPIDLEKELRIRLDLLVKDA